MRLEEVESENLSLWRLFAIYQTAKLKVGMLVYLADHYGDIASVLGLILAVCGFWLTLRDVKKAKLAAEAARQAAKDAVEKIGSRLLANEIGTLLQLIREIDLACRERNRTIVVYRCDEARARLAEVVGNPGVSPAEGKTLRKSIDDLRDIMQEFAHSETAGQDPRNLEKTHERLHGVIVLMGKIKGRLQAASLEV